MAHASRCIPTPAADETSPSGLSDQYAEMALHELDQLHEGSHLLKLQCCLILCIYDVGNGAEHSGWLRLREAVRLTQLLRLHKLDSISSELDRDNAQPPQPVSKIESLRRTFWCCFSLERFWTNGCDRTVEFVPGDVTTRFPMSEENFLDENDVPNCTLSCPGACTEHNHEQNGLLGHAIRLVDIVSNIMTWRGRGGRHLDPRCPWLPDSTFSSLNNQLRQWKSSIPKSLDCTPQTLPAILAAGRGKAWSSMYLIYYQAQVYLYREYLPFVPQWDYDPANGEHQASITCTHQW